MKIYVAILYTLLIKLLWLSALLGCGAIFATVCKNLDTFFIKTHWYCIGPIIESFFPPPLNTSFIWIMFFIFMFQKSKEYPCIGFSSNGFNICLSVIFSFSFFSWQSKKRTLFNHRQNLFTMNTLTQGFWFWATIAATRCQAVTAI